ncbi:MAG: type II secretion system protein [Gammaproteobacteria bacterium]|nr:type II secretion system protein [Gammaproteobacteria bacterium]
MRMQQQKPSQHGFTLIETIIVIVLVGTMMAGMSALFVSGIEDSHRPYLRQRALAVSTAMMDEILHKRWNENSPLGGGCVNTGSTCTSNVTMMTSIGAETGEARADYDDIDDYSAIINQSPPQNSNGIDMPGYNGFSLTVSISQPGANWNGIIAADVRLITVSVTSSSNETLALTAYRVNN